MSKPDDELIFKMWSKQEDITMHFNELLSRIRTQGLAGLGALGTLLFHLNEKQPTPPGERSTTSTVDSFAIDSSVSILLALMLAWVALASLDYAYYQRLLDGSVKALVKLEEKMPSEFRYSQTVEGAFAGTISGHRWFYAIPQVALGIATAIAIYESPGPQWGKGLLGFVLAGVLVLTGYVVKPLKRSKQ